MNDEAVAIHEAGHCVAAAVLGFAIERVTVTRSILVANDTWDAFRSVSFVHLDGDPEHHAIIALAGPAASRRRGDPEDGMRGDFERAARYVDQAAGEHLYVGICTSAPIRSIGRPSPCARGGKPSSSSNATGLM